MEAPLILVLGGRSPKRSIIWKDEDANKIHGESAAVKKFAGLLYPNCLAPVEFIKYRQVDANVVSRRS
jgi:hypothetical protein